MMELKVKDISDHGKLNILMKESRKEWVCNGHQEKEYFMGNLNKIKGMGKGRNKIHPQDRLSLAPGGTELDTDKGKPGSEMG